MRIAQELRGQGREQHGLAGAGRADDHRVTNIADMEIEAERRCAIGRRQHQRRRIQMRVVRRPGPDGAQGEKMGQAGREKNGPPHVRISLTRQPAEPSLNRIHAFHFGDEAQTIGDLLDLAHAFFGDGFVRLGHDNGKRGISGRDCVGAEVLQRVVAILGLIGRIIVDEQRLLAEERFTQ